MLLVGLGDGIDETRDELRLAAFGRKLHNLRAFYRLDAQHALCRSHWVRP
jgi:hypothetical protein